ncbi:MAG: hypothetical protein SGI71_06245 [Verrucomicrobiota bacterium]|nr:hypothetical protein [Verrucomicrobiota bacterium]
MKSLDLKLAEIKANPRSKAFIIADAKDADMAFGIGSPGIKPNQSPETIKAGEVKFRSLPEYQKQIREVIKQGLVDIVLASASNIEQLAIKEKLFENSHITPAARANDTTDIWVIRNGAYITEPSQPFRTASIDHIQCGKLECAEAERVLGANLGLYSVTFSNNIDRDRTTLLAFKEFRMEAEKKGFNYFLEVFDPNVAAGIPAEKLGQFINDHIVRSLAGVTERGRPVFLKMVYHGPQSTEELASYDPQLVIGILGGGAGTTYDAFKLISEAQKYGARVALFGRKINMAEHQLGFIEFLRMIVEGQISPEEAVHAYHGVLQGLKIRPHRSLADDLLLQTGVMSYGGTTTVTLPKGTPKKSGSNGVSQKGLPSGEKKLMIEAQMPGAEERHAHVQKQLERLRARLG